MNKYVIELRPDCKVVQQICESDGQVSIGSQSIVYLEELNSDYINEHFGDLQDTAYQKGLRDGESKCRYCNEYQRGFEDGKAVHEKGCEECKYEQGGLYDACNQCCNSYHNQWTAKSPIDDGFVRGDEVVGEDGVRGIVVSSENNESNLLYILFNGYRIPQSGLQKHYKKTGKHYNIDEFLDEIKGDSDK